MKINFVYHTPVNLGSAYMCSEGFKRALEKNGYLHYAHNTNRDTFLDIDKLREKPIFFIRGFLPGRLSIVAKTANQFKAILQSESFYTRHGNADPSTPAMINNQHLFHLCFTCADTDVEGVYKIPTRYLMSWADTTLLYPRCEPFRDELAFIGNVQGREDWICNDRDKVMKVFNTPAVKLHDRPAQDAVATTELYAQALSEYKIGLGLPGRFFTGMPGRAFEIMACGSMCLQYFNADTMYRTAEFFRDGENIVYYKTYDEMVEKYRYYLTHDEERQRIAKAGCDEVHRNHNQDVRAKYVVDTMEEIYRDWQVEQSKIPEYIKDMHVGR